MDRFDFSSLHDANSCPFSSACVPLGVSLQPLLLSLGTRDRLCKDLFRASLLLVPLPCTLHCTGARCTAAAAGSNGLRSLSRALHTRTPSLDYEAEVCLWSALERKEIVSANIRPQTRSRPSPSPRPLARVQAASLGRPLNPLLNLHARQTHVVKDEQSICIDEGRRMHYEARRQATFCCCSLTSSSSSCVHDVHPLLCVHDTATPRHTVLVPCDLQRGYCLDCYVVLLQRTAN